MGEGTVNPSQIMVSKTGREEREFPQIPIFISKIMEW
jgi:hypothetical protein